jgi:hypothetical protein
MDTQVCASGWGNVGGVRDNYRTNYNIVFGGVTTRDNTSPARWVGTDHTDTV